MLRASGTLKALPGSGSASASSASAAARKFSSVGRRAPQRRLGLRGAPRLVRHAAERDAHVAHDAVGDVERGRDRDQREGVGGPVAHLAVAEFVAKASGGRSTAVISSPCSSTVSRSGSSPGRRCSSVSGIVRSPSGPVRDHRVERGHRHGHVRRVGGDARSRGAEDRQAPGGSPPAPSSPSPARACCTAWWFLEVHAAGALQQVPAGRGEVAQLARGARQQRLGEHRDSARGPSGRRPDRCWAPRRRSAGRRRAAPRSGPRSAA